jgi:hypothetical protein
MEEKKFIVDIHDFNLYFVFLFVCQEFNFEKNKNSFCNIFKVVRMRDNFILQVKYVLVCAEEIF